MHSVELSPVFYRDNSKSSGFLADVAKKVLHVKNHQFHFGAAVPKFINEIGGDIDFLILDTVHSLPGEILDFLVVLPLLKPNAIVCMHDVAMNQYDVASPMSHATNLLFSSVTADKIFNFVPEGLNNTPLRITHFRYPNIAAFQINQETVRNIINVVLALNLRWAYLPSNADLINYTACIHQMYDKNICRIYDEAVNMNLYNMIMMTNTYDKTLKENVYNMMKNIYRIQS